MNNYFLAIDLDEETRKLFKRELKDWLIKYKYERIVHSSKWHMTLAFLGKLTSDQVSILLGKLHSLEFTKFEVNFNHIGVFPDTDEARVLWIGIEDQFPIYNLASILREQLHNCNIPFDQKQFIPHATIIRFKTVRIVTQMIERAKFNSIRMPVTKLSLYQSLSPQIPYKLIDSFQLK